MYKRRLIQKQKGWTNIRQTEVGVTIYVGINTTRS